MGRSVKRIQRVTVSQPKPTQAVARIRRVPSLPDVVFGRTVVKIEKLEEPNELFHTLLMCSSLGPLPHPLLSEADEQALCSRVYELYDEVTHRYKRYLSKRQIADARLHRKYPDAITEEALAYYCYHISKKDARSAINGYR